MVYLRTAWLIVSALAGPLVSIAVAQAPSPDALRSASDTRSAAETLAQKQRKATLAATEASIDRQRVSVAAGVAASVGKQPSRSAAPTSHTFFTLPPMPPPAMGAAPREMVPAIQPGLYCDPVSAADLAPVVLDAAQREGLEPRLLTAVIEQESAFRPCAVSGKGAQGLMQLMPATAEQFGVRDPFDINQHIGGGARLLKEQLARYSGALS